jgi:hypothetical protein
MAQAARNLSSVLWHFSPLTLTLIYATYAFGVLTSLLLFGACLTIWAVGETDPRRIAAGMEVKKHCARRAQRGARRESLHAASDEQPLFPLILATTAWNLDQRPGPPASRTAGELTNRAQVPHLDRLC